MTEFTRLGEMRRSIEQTMINDGSDLAYSLGAVRGFKRSLVRTGVGIYEVVTFPIPKYNSRKRVARA